MVTSADVATAESAGPVPATAITVTPERPTSARRCVESLARTSSVSPWRASSISTTATLEGIAASARASAPSTESATMRDDTQAERVRMARA